MSDMRRADFHTQIDEVRHGIAALSATVTEMIPRVTDIVLEGDLEGAAYVVASAPEIDERSRSLEERCFSMLALQQPVAGDLRQLVAATKILADVERSAHLCANIAKGARRMFSHELDPAIRGIIQRMGDQGALLFKHATEAYLQNSEVLALALQDIDVYMDGLHRDLFATIFQTYGAGTTDFQVGVQLALVGRFYERIGDHAVNIGEHTAYIVSGTFPLHIYDESGNEVPDASEPPGGD